MTDHPSPKGERAMTPDNLREAVAQKLARAFGSLEATEEPCETCRGKGVYLAGDDAGGCDDCAGTGIVYDWDEAEAWRLAADVALSLPALSVPEGWRPIETAPKDGTVIHIWSEYGQAIASRYWDPAFTHWRPLPDPPLSAIPSPGGEGNV